MDPQPKAEHGGSVEVAQIYPQLFEAEFKFPDPMGRGAVGRSAKASANERRAGFRQNTRPSAWAEVILASQFNGRTGPNTVVGVAAGRNDTIAVKVEGKPKIVASTGIVARIGGKVKRQIEVLVVVFGHEESGPWDGDLAATGPLAGSEGAIYGNRSGRPGASDCCHLKKSG